MEPKRLPLGLKTTTGLPYTVMVIDDSTMMRKLLGQILRSESFQICGEAENGAQAVNIYHDLEKKPDMIFVDVEMPELNGIDTVKELKANNCTSQCIMCTSVTEEESVKELIRLGISGYIVKPFDRIMVLKKLATILKRTDFLSDLDQ